MTPDEEAEAYARIIYHLPWVIETEPPTGGPRPKDLLWLIERSVRLYVLLVKFCPDKLLPMLEVVWPGVAKSVLEDETLLAISARDAPKMFGREAYERKEREQRLRLTSDLHDMVVSLWRTGGKYIISGGQDLSTLVREADRTVAETESGIGAIVERAIYAPTSKDERLVKGAQEALVKQALATPKRRHTEAEFWEWATNTITLPLVPEARRRAASSPISQVLAEAEKKWRTEGMTKEQIGTARVEMIDALRSATS